MRTRRRTRVAYLGISWMLVGALLISFGDNEHLTARR